MSTGEAIGSNIGKEKRGSNSKVGGRKWGQEVRQRKERRTQRRRLGHSFCRGCREGSKETEGAKRTKGKRGESNGEGGMSRRRDSKRCQGPNRAL